MKRFIFSLLALLMLLTLASCGEKAEETKGGSTLAADSAALINQVWEKFGEEETFAVMGGDMTSPTDGKAGKLNLEDVESVTASLHITEDALKKVTDGASMIHMMNANTFTCAAYRTEDTAALASSLKDSIKSTQWMCGFPETLVIYTIGDEYVLAAFGTTQNVENLEKHLKATYGEAAVQNTKEALA